MRVDRDELLWIADLVKELCGVILDETKGYLVESRLLQLARENGCADYRQLCQKAINGDKKIRESIIDSITTQETLFFRDQTPFDAMQFKLLPEMIDAKANTAHPTRLRLWSAACSTGQEPYSLAMVLSELIPDIHQWDVTIVATDISDAAIERASLGHFTPLEIARGMKAPLLKKYFHEEDNGWRVKDELRSLVHFQHRNLLDPFSDLGLFDIILCRNVAIYFDADSRTNLFRRMARHLDKDGVLFVGSSEPLSELTANFTTAYCCNAVCYRPKPSTIHAASPQTG